MEPHVGAALLMAESVIDRSPRAEERTQVEVEFLMVAEGHLGTLPHLLEEKASLSQLLVDSQHIRHHFSEPSIGSRRKGAGPQVYRHQCPRDGSPGRLASSPNERANLPGPLQRRGVARN